MTTIVTIDMGGTGATHAAGAREALSVPSMTDMGQSYAQANSARDQANTARGNANDAYSQANTAYSQANSARDQANTAYGQANSARSDANTTFATINTTFGTVNTNYQAAYAQANTARTTANDAYGAANTKLASAGGTLSGDLIITGNLTVSGNQTILNTEVLTTEDADIILLSNTSSTPALNAGLIINRGTSTNTFLRWDEATDKWGWSDSGTTTYYFEDLRQGLSTTNTTFATINTSLGTINTSYQAAYSQANTAGTNSLNAYGQANAAYSQANSAYGAANNRVLKAGDTMTGTLTMGANISFQNDETAYWIKPPFNGGAIRFRSNVGASTDRGLQFGNIDNAGGWTSYMTVNTGGNVGIGTTSPSTKLHLYESGAADVLFRLTSANGTYDPLIQFTGQGNDITAEGFEIWYDNDVGDVHLSTTYPNDGATIHFHTRTGASKSTSNERLTILGNGNVGIGTTSPGVKLHVVGDVRFGAAATGGSTAGNLYIAGNRLWRWIAGYSPDYGIGNGFGLYDDTGGAYRITFDTSGNVGIGTTTPSQKLHVDGGSALIANGSSNTALWLGNSAYGFELEYSTGKIHTTINSAKRVTVDNSGNVGIGVTTPQRKLDVFGSGILASFGSQMGVNSIAGIHFGYSESSSNVDTYKKSAMVFERTDNHNQGGNASGKIHFLLHNSGSTSASGANSAVLTLDTDSNGTLGSARVGIGTTSPTAALHVSGTSGDSAPTFRINGTAAASTFNWAGSIMNSSLGSGYNTILLIGKLESNRNCGYIGFNHSGTNGSNTNFLTFGLHSVDNVLNITGAGNVGIGTTTPATKLHVAGAGTFTGQLNTADIISLGYNTNGSVATSARRGIEFHNEGGSDYWIGKRAGAWTQPLDIAFYTGIRYHAHNTYNGHRFFVGGHDSTEAFSVGNGDNHVRVLYNLSVAGTITESSSIALKENISPITNALDSIAKLVGVTYDRKDGSAKNRAGLIKEEVEKVIPNIVNDDGIQYTNLIAYLVESIKELKFEIDTLKGK
jgi:hypothetical protein